MASSPGHIDIYHETNNYGHLAISENDNNVQMN